MIKEYQIIIAGALIGIGLYFGLKEMKPDPQPTEFEECVEAITGISYAGGNAWTKNQASVMCQFKDNFHIL